MHFSKKKFIVLFSYADLQRLHIGICFVTYSEVLDMIIKVKQKKIIKRKIITKIITNKQIAKTNFSMAN